MKSLTFAPSRDGRTRRALLAERSLLPLSAACVVASGVRERLAQLFESAVTLRLFEPAIPSQRGWNRIVEGARCYRVNGERCDAAVVLRPHDAVALASAAFGETVAGAACERALSPMEREVVDRIANAVAAALSPISASRECRVRAEPASIVAGFATYFELAVEEPVTARVGIALSRDPSPESTGTLRFEDLAELSLCARVQVKICSLEAAAVAALAPGDFVPITRSSALRGTLRIGGRTLVHGSCGVRNGRFAIAIEG